MQALSETQITEICNSLPINRGIPLKVAQSCLEKIQEKLRSDLRTVKIYPSCFNKYKDEIIHFYHKTLVQAGEAVGIITAQSIGERQTQTTLNSLDWLEKIIVNITDNDNNNIIIEPIGKFIDNILDKNCKNIEYIEENNTEYLDIKNRNMYMPSVDENGYTSWLKIEAVTRHLPVGKLVKIKTKSGREVTATQSKSFLIFENDKFVDKNGSDIKIGDMVPTNTFLPKTKKSVNYFNKDDGLVFGLFILFGDIHIVENKPKIVIDKESNKKLIIDFCKRNDVKYYINENVITLYTKLFELCYSEKNMEKIIPNFTFIENSDFQKGILEGIFQTDKLTSFKHNSKDLLDGIAFLLYYFGISTYFENDTILIDDKSKILQKNNVLLDEIISIDFVESSREKVYDFTIENTRNFGIFNGLQMRDSFHSAGITIKTVITGVPRFSELLNATKDPKMVNCLIYLNEEFNDIISIRKRIGNMFTEIKLKRLVLSYYLIKDPLEDWHHIFCDIYKINKNNLGWRVRFNLDINKLFEYNITMRMIKNAIENIHSNVTVLYLPESKGIIDIFINDYAIEKKNEEEEVDEVEEEEVDEEVDDFSYNEEDGENDDNDENDDSKDIKKDVQIIKEKFDHIPIDIVKVIAIEDEILPLLLSVQICGISGITDIFFEKRKESDGERWIVTTEGSNLIHLFANPIVDNKKTLCNNMWEIYERFGIEATRQFLIEEFMDVVSSDGTYVNSSHVELLVDLMVYTGSIISISRYGQKKVSSGPLSNASFEESLENFLKAGLNGAKETTDGVSAAIILGKMPKIGTGVFDLKVDIKKLLQNKPIIKQVESNENIKKIDTDNLGPIKETILESVKEPNLKPNLETIKEDDNLDNKPVKKKSIFKSKTVIEKDLKKFSSDNSFFD